jgi:hypothetical protein
MFSTCLVRSVRYYAHGPAFGEEERLGFKDALDKFVRTYAFLTVEHTERLLAGM